MKILIALDTSPASWHAIEAIAERSWGADSSFEVISVVEPSHLWTTSEVAQEASRCAQQVVDHALEYLVSKGLPATGHTLPGDTKSVILDHAKASSADLIVVGSHGNSGVTRLLLGSVASAVLRHAHCSVEIVRGESKPDFSAGMKILLATDGSAFSERAAKSIAARHWPPGSEVRILSEVQLVLTPTRAMLEIPFLDTSFLESARAEAMQHSQDAVSAAMDILASAGMKLSEAISVLVDTPQTIILQEADEWEADLIVLGSHGRSAFDRFLLGSVSEAVATHAECSVEVIR